MLDHWKKQWIKPGVTRVLKLWLREYKDTPLRNSLSMFTPAQLSTSPVCADPDNVEPSFFRQQQRARKRQKIAISDEFEQFIKQAPVACDNPIQWWLQPEQQSTYPHLAAMAIDVLSSPLMSAEAERVFSMARRTISWDRTSLTTLTVEASELMKSWQQNGFLDLEDYGSSSKDEDEDSGAYEGVGDTPVTGTATPCDSFIRVGQS